MQSLRKPQDPSRRPLDWFLLGYHQNKPKSKLDVAESNFTLIGIYITGRETWEEHINNVLLVAGLSGGEFSALVLICMHTPAPCGETPNLPSVHRSKLPEAESHRLGCRLRLNYTRGSHSCIPEPRMEKHGELPHLVNLEDIFCSLNFFPSSGLDIYDNSPRKCKLGSFDCWVFPPVTVPPLIHPVLTQVGGTPKQNYYLGMTQYHQFLRQLHNTVLLNSHKLLVPPVRIKWE